jgi:hypothetical protein
MLLDSRREDKVLDRMVASSTRIKSALLFNIATDLKKALPGNGSVNTSQRATMETVSQWTNVIARC